MISLAGERNERRTRRISSLKNTRIIFIDGTINVGVCVRKNNIISSTCVWRLSPQDTGVQTVKKLSLFLFVPFSLTCCIGGCGSDCTDSDGQPQICTAILPKPPLPAGWKLVPSSEMPLSPRMYSWKKNPIIWTGSEVKEFASEDQPVIASRALAAIYRKDDEDGRRWVRIYFDTFPTQSDAMRYYDYAQEMIPSGGLVGYYLSVPNTVIILRYDQNCPDRHFFIQYFNANSSQSPNTPKDN